MFRFDRRLLHNFDWCMLGIVLVIAALGLVNLYSSSYIGNGAGSTVFYKQLYFFITGFIIIFAIISVDYSYLLKLNYPLYTLVIFLLLLSLFSGGRVAGAQRWINLGFFNLQPSEPAKLMLVITLASYYFRKDSGNGFSFKEMLAPIGLFLLPFILIYKQPDLGTALMLGAIFVSMTLFINLRRSTIIILSLLCIIVAAVGWKYMLKPYQRQRVETFFNQESDPQKSGYQIRQSKIAVGSGLMLGKGYLKGTQGHLHFLPERHTDFAFSVWAEEWGFAGSLFFLVCYFFMILWGVNIGISSRDKFGMLLAFGIVCLIFWQATINLLMVMGFLPVVGIPLPLFSYGGSSLLTTMAGLGILINIKMRRFQGNK